MPGCSGNGGCYPTSSRPITPILRPGAPSVLADRHRRGAMYGWRQTCAIPGRRSSVQRTQPFWRRENLVTDDPQRPRAQAGRAPDVFVPRGWVPTRDYSEEEETDFEIDGTGAGGGPVPGRAPAAGGSVGG